MWHFGLTDLSGVPIGEVFNAKERTLSLRHNGAQTASLTIPLADSLAKEIEDRRGDVLLKVYQGSTLRFVGDCKGWDAIGEDGELSLAAPFAGPLSRLQERLIGKTMPGFGYSPVQTTDEPFDTTLRNLLAAANLETDTGIREGTFAPLYPASIGPWDFKPFAEGILETQKAKLPFPSWSLSGVTRLAYDHGVGGGEALTGSADDLGNVWAAAGDAGDYTVGGTGIFRTAVSGSAGRWAISGLAARANAVVGVNWSTNVTSRPGPHNMGLGVFARYTDLNNWLRVVIDYNLTDGQWAIQKMVGGSFSTLNIAPVPAGFFFQANTTYTLRLTGDDSGNCFALFGNADGTASLSAYHADLAAGGPLATGKCGIFDAVVSSEAITRTYAEFVVTDYPGIQSFDFEFVPVEPTLSDPVTSAQPEVKIADLNVALSLGQERPHAVFEFGDGAHSIKSWRCQSSRDILNRAFALPPDFPTPNALGQVATRMAVDDVSIDDRHQLYEEVIPSDLQDPALLQALVDAYVQVRKVPRQIFSFEATASAPVFGTDYFIADTVPVRVTVAGEKRFEGLVRVWGIDLSIDENGEETLTPILVDEG
jgi:hypothetical protein